MKIALVLLSCLVAMSTSYRQNFVFAPRIGYLPYFYDIVPNDQSFPSESENDYESEPEGEYNILGRTKLSQRVQNRLFLANPFSLFNSQPPITNTVWVKENKTLTTTSVQLCIPSSSFGGDGKNPPASLTAPCARRRREVALVDDFLETIQPTETKQIEASAIPAQDRQVADEPLLISSKDQIVEAPRRRMARSLVAVVTSTATSFTFIPTVIQKTLTNLGDNLGCLPPGLAVCTADAARKLLVSE